LRILRLSEPEYTGQPDNPKAAIGRGGHRLEASRNYWDASGLKTDFVSTDVAWGRGGAFPHLHTIKSERVEPEFGLISVQQQNPHK
jgi:hypothetical protein